MSDNNQSNTPAVKMTAMNKWYDQFHVLKDINLEVADGEKIVICGPSGSGKSTLIRCICKLEDHQRGGINVLGTELNDDIANIDEIRREVGMVFQAFNLFPHMTVMENCTLAQMLVRKTPRKEAEAIALGFLEKVRIPEQANKYPGELSGGQQQRVAIARSLCMNPKICLARSPCPSPHSARQLGECVFDLRVGDPPPPVAFAQRGFPSVLLAKPRAAIALPRTTSRR